MKQLYLKIKSIRDRVLSPESKDDEVTLQDIFDIQETKTNNKLCKGGKLPELTPKHIDDGLIKADYIDNFDESKSVKEQDNKTLKQIYNIIVNN